MIRVHCFVSCLCESLKKVDGVDQRPFYFGVWDAEFSVTERYELAYHSPEFDQGFFREWYERLYGVPVTGWYDTSLGKEANIEQLCQLIESRPVDRKVVVMLDLFRLPERENKFNQNPFPHYVMLQATEDPEQWMMLDPDFRWEGVLPKSRVLDAVASPSVAGGYTFDERRVRPARDEDVRRYFELCLREDNPLTDAIRRIVSAHLDERATTGLGGLARALREIPVLAIRKYAYEHGFAFFFRALGLGRGEFEGWCDAIETLVKTYTTVQYRAMKLSLAGERALARGVFELLDQQDELERGIKKRLNEVFRSWCSAEVKTLWASQKMAGEDAIQ